MKSIRMGIVALFLAIAGIFSLGSVASAADTGWVYKGWGDGSSGYGGCTGYIRAWDSPYGVAIGAMHEYTDCDMVNGYHKAQLAWSGGAQNWYTYSYNSYEHYYGFAAFSVGACQYFQATIHGSVNQVNC